MTIKKFSKLPQSRKRRRSVRRNRSGKNRSFVWTVTPPMTANLDRLIVLYIPQMLWNLHRRTTVYT